MAIVRISPSLIAAGVTGSFALDLTGSDQFVIVVATMALGNDFAASDITLDSVSGTRLGDILADGGRAASCSVFYWKEADLPVSGGNYTITATWPVTPGDDTLCVLEWSGVDQTSPISALFSNTALDLAPAGTISSTITGESGEYGISLLTTGDNVSGSSSNTIPSSTTSIALLDNGEQSTQVGEDAVIASASEAYQWTPAWAGGATIDTVLTGSFALREASTAAPVLSLPTEASITDTTVTVGATTDDATGTLYYYISTSATPPSASNLKDGTGSVKFGNTASVSVGINTFPVTGLTASTTYYTYFIQNDGSSDSNLLESGSWATTATAVTRNVTANNETGRTTAQTMIAVANTSDDESFFGSTWITVEDDMQLDIPTIVNGMTITLDASGDGTFTTDLNQTETFEAKYFSPANSQWSVLDFTITATGPAPIMPADTTNNVTEPSQAFGTFAASNTPEPAAVYTKTGADAGVISINSSTGAVTADAPTDASVKSTYTYTVTATNSAGADSQNIVTTILESSEPSAYTPKTRLNLYRQ